MESIINGQRVSHRRSAAPRLRGEELFAPDRVLARKTLPEKRSPLLSRRLPTSTTPADYAFLERGERTVQFRQSPSARRERRSPDAGAKGAGRLARLGGTLLGSSRSAALRFGRAITGLSPKALIVAALAAVLLGAVLFVGNQVLHPSLPLPQGALLPEDGTNEDLLLAYVTPEMSGDLQDTNIANLPPPPAMLELRSYTVRKNDSLASVAKRFGLAVDTLVSMNGITNARSFKLGTELRIPNMNGLLYKVRPGDSLSSIAKLYKIDGSRIADANDLGSATIKVGQSLFIPGARLPEAALKSILGEKVMWPIRGPLSSYFGYRPDPFTGVRSFHAGIDIAADPGSPVKAAMDGRVADVGYNPTFGNYVILSHANGIQTLYGHLTSYSVRIGQAVSQGSLVGLVGSTGYSTGPHLHFGLYQHGNPVDPLKYLK